MKKLPFFNKYKSYNQTNQLTQIFICDKVNGCTRLFVQKIAKKSTLIRRTEKETKVNL